MSQQVVLFAVVLLGESSVSSGLLREVEMGKLDDLLCDLEKKAGPHLEKVEDKVGPAAEKVCDVAEEGLASIINLALRFLEKKNEGNTEEG